MRKILLFYILTFCLSYTVNGQLFDGVEENLQYLKEYKGKYPKEKVYLHLDRTYYAPGDDLWFKNYVTIGSFNYLSQYSKIIYVDLIGPDSKIFKALRMPLYAGVSFGDFELPEYIPAGDYRIRAYTQWRRNFDEGYFFEKAITILNPLIPAKKVNATENKNDKNTKKSVLGNTGFTMDINYRSDSVIKVIVAINQDEIKDQQVNIIVQNQGEVFYAAKAPITQSGRVFTIPIKSLGGGINEISLFSADKKLLAFKHYFNSPPELPIQIELDKQSYKTREKVKVDMCIDQEVGKSGLGAFSVSVTHNGKAPWNEERQGNIKSYLLLRSFMKSDLASPLSYFTGDGSERKEKVNNLLAGWGRDEVWAGFGKKGAQYPVEKALTVSGTVSSLMGKLQANANVILYTNDSGGLLLDTLTDEKGRFTFDEMLFYDTTQFVVQARSEKGSKHLRIKLDTVGRQQVSRKNDYTFSVYSEQDDFAFSGNNKDRVMQQFNDIMKGTVLDEVKIEGRSGKVTHSANLNGPGNADQVITADKLTKCSSLEMCLQFLLHGVIFKNGVPYSSRTPSIPMGVLIDGMEVDDISSLSPDDVESVEVLRTVSYLTVYNMSGRGGGAGVLIITTKTGRTRSNASIYAPGVLTYEPQGLSIVREFNSPDYSIASDMHSKPDLRTTIFWKPDIVTDENGKTSFEFYTSDQPGKYRIVLEGIDLYGKLGYIVKEFEVK